MGLARTLALALLVSFAGIGSAAALDYPTHAVKWIVPYPPGGTTDVLARIVSQWLSEKMGQPFIIENKAGAGNNIGVEYVVHAAPDGYTMLLVNPANGINATLYKNLPFDFIRDIAPVAGLVRTPNVMEVTNSFPARTVAEFIAYCKANPGKINMASSSSGTSVHLSGELFKSMTGCDMLHVPFKGAGPALAELIAGNVHVIFDNLPSSIGHIKGGRIRALAVTSAEREPSLPGLSTVAETVPGYEATAWFGIGMPRGTPAEIIEKVNAETNRALADPKMLARLAELGGSRSKARRRISARSSPPRRRSGRRSSSPRARKWSDAPCPGLSGFSAAAVFAGAGRGPLRDQAPDPRKRGARRVLARRNRLTARGEIGRAHLGEIRPDDDVGKLALCLRERMLHDDERVAQHRRGAAELLVLVRLPRDVDGDDEVGARFAPDLHRHRAHERSEERRVGKECRSRWS